VPNKNLAKQDKLSRTKERLQKMFAKGHKNKTQKKNNKKANKKPIEGSS